MTKKSSTPAIRFKGFTDTWEQRKLGEIGSVSMCRRIFKEQTSETGDIPFYKIGTFGAEPDAFISRELFEEYKSKYPYPKKGDILISASGSIGRTVEFAGNNEYFQDSNIVWLSHDERLSNSFLKCFYSVVKWAGIEGSTIKRLYNDNILNTVICMPSVPEQEHIGLFFENLDNLITLHQRKYDKLTNVKKSMLEKMFPKNGSNVPEIRFKGFTEAWEQRKLGEMCSLITKGTTPLDKSSVGTINFVKIESIDEASGEIKITQKITDEEHNGYLRRSQLKENDILFSIAGTLGRVTSVKSDILPANTNQALAIIRLKSGCLQYIKTYLRGKAVAEFIKKNPTIGAQPNLSLEQVGNLEISLPTEKEQELIGEYFRNLDNLITLHQRELEKLKNLKKACLEKMFV